MDSNSNIDIGYIVSYFPYTGKAWRWLKNFLPIKAMYSEKLLISLVKLEVAKKKKKWELLLKHFYYRILFSLAIATYYLIFFKC